MATSEEQEGEKGEKKEAVILRFPILLPDFDVHNEVLEVLKEAPDCSLLIVEDIEFGDLYFIKRLLLEPGERREKVKNYYKTLESFSKSSLAPADLIKIWKTTSFVNKSDGSEEFLVNFEWGEADCIDLSRLTKIQTIKFLKNIIEILEVTYNITNICHSNISLKNILLVGSQLKLSGWQPNLISNKGIQGSLCS